MTKLGKNLHVVEKGDNVAIEYKHQGVPGTEVNIMFDSNGINFNTTLALSNLMPLSYSSAFQTATLASTFQRTGLVAFANIAGYSWTSTVNGISTTFALKTA